MSIRQDRRTQCPTAWHMIQAAGWRGTQDEMRRLIIEAMRYVGAVDASGELMTADRLGQSPHISMHLVDWVRVKSSCPVLEDWMIMKFLFWLRKHRRLMGASCRLVSAAEFKEMVLLAGYHESAEQFLQEVIVHFQWWFPGMHDEAAMCHPRRLYAFVCDCQQQLRVELSDYDWSVVLLKMSNMRKRSVADSLLAGDSQR